MRIKCIGLTLLAGLSVLISGCRSFVTNEQHRPIIIKGSDTMVILTQSWAASFMKEHSGLRVQVTGGGSGIGITALINGGTDICQASRPMKALEKQQVRNHSGVEAKEIPVALDGLAVYISESNPIQSLTMLQLKAIYTGKITNWREVGGRDAIVVAYGRDSNSGTNNFFREHVLNNEEYARTVRILPGTIAIAREIAKDPASIGYGGIAYASGIRVVPIRRDDKSEAVTPTRDSVKSGQYALSRNLFFYTLGDPSGDIKLFVDWVLGPKGQELCTTIGYYPIVQN